MVEMKDISVKIALNYQGYGKCPIKQGRYDVQDNLSIDLTSDYDEQEDDSIVCVNMVLTNVGIPDMLTQISTWINSNLNEYELVSSEVHCQVSTKKINSREAQEIKYDTSAWQHDVLNNQHIFVYFDDFEGSVSKLERQISSRVKKFWTVLDSNINI